LALVVLEDLVVQTLMDLVEAQVSLVQFHLLVVAVAGVRQMLV
jgi:hypothetical protein